MGACCWVLGIPIIRRRLVGVAIRQWASLDDAGKEEWEREEKLSEPDVRFAELGDRRGGRLPDSENRSAQEFEEFFHKQWGNGNGSKRSWGCVSLMYTSVQTKVECQ